MGVNSLPKTVTRQRRDCDLKPDLDTRPIYIQFLWATRVCVYKSKRHLDRFIRFCRARGRDYHTDTQTTPHSP